MSRTGAARKYRCCFARKDVIIRNTAERRLAMPAYIVKTAGMRCHHCAGSVKKALSGLDGVARVEADPKAGTAIITADGPVPASEVSDAVEDIGFEFLSMEEKA